MSTLRVGRRRSAILPTLVIVAVLVVVFAIFTSVWTDRLWYRSFDYGSVFSTMLLTRIGLFAAFGLIMATCVAANAAIAYRLRPRLGTPDSVQPAAGALPGAAGVAVRLDHGRSSAVAGRAVRRRHGERSGLRLPGLAQRDAVQHRRPAVRHRRLLLRLRLPVVAVRAVLRLRRARHRARVAAAIVHYTMGGLRFSGPRRGGQPRRPRPTCRS